MKTILLALLLFINAQAQLVLYDDFSLNDIPGLELLVLPSRDLAGGVPANVSDYSGNGNNGTFENSMELNQTAGLDYFTFDGTDDYISLGDVLNLQDNFTVMVAFNAEPYTTTNQDIIFGKYDIASQRSYLFYVNAKKLNVIFSSDGIVFNRQSIGEENDFFDSNSYLWGVSKTGATYQHCINGIIEPYTNEFGSELSTLHITPADLAIGTFYNSGVPSAIISSGFKIGVIIVANSVLTPAQQKQIYNSPEIQSIIAGM